MGFAKHPELTGGVTRRIDIRVMHHTSQPSAMFGWTGNTQLNRALKRFSANLCFEFSETNLLPSVGARDSTMELKDARTSQWKDVKDAWLQSTRGAELESELDIFSFYGLRYIPPEERNVLAVLERVARARDGARARERARACVRPRSAYALTRVRPRALALTTKPASPAPARGRDDGEAHQQANKSTEKVDELLESREADDAREADNARRDDEDNLINFEGLAAGHDDDTTDDEKGGDR
jgi:hypothetical protein